MSRLILPPKEELRSALKQARQAAAGQSEPPPMSDLGFELPSPARLSARQAVALLLVVSAVAGAAFVSRWLPLQRAKRALAADVSLREDGPLRVQVLAPKLKSSRQALSLPGSVQPLQEILLYPRASGYVRRWFFDIGDHVKAGQELVVIDTPELDQQLNQARAQLAQAQASLLQARANSEFSKLDLKRFERMAPEGVATQQELDKSRAQAAVDVANVSVAQSVIDAQRANIQRLTQLKSFARVIAPFDGLVTARSIDIGSLVTEGNGTPLFKVTATDPVRVFVQVPQGLALAVTHEVPATVHVREYPSRSFVGTVARTSGALDTLTRTMNTEIRVPNPKGELLTGMYAEVSLNLPTPHGIYEIPATALLNDAAGLRVATITPDNKVHLTPVVIERDNGPTIDLASGLGGNERIIPVASAELFEGRKVSVNMR
jgi:RND family efflux transporter MFP subunit